MTNEEKTDILVSNYYINESDSPEGAQGVRYGAEMMAEWKDEQLKNYLQLTKLNCNASAKVVYAYDMSSAYELELKAKFCDEIINELFGGE